MDGNFSAMSGNTPGCHGAHSPKYIRRVQVNKDEEAGKIYQKVNPSAVMESVSSSNNTDNIILFAEECNPGTIYKDDLLGVKQLEIVKLLQNSWVREGSRNKSSKIEHNVSNTVLIDNNWDEVRDYIWENRYDFAGISLLPKVGDLIYPQAPYTEVKDPYGLLMEYGDGIIFASGLIVDSEAAFGNLWDSCNCFNGIGEKLSSTEDDAEQFINENFTINHDSEKMLDLTYRDVLSLKASINDNKILLLKTLGYSEEFSENLVNNNIPIPIQEVIKYLDETNFNHIHKLNEKRNIIRRFKKFAINYFDGNEEEMIFALKHVQVYHDWCNIKRHHRDINWKNIKWKEVEGIDIDTTAGASCAAGSCEITKI